METPDLKPAPAAEDPFLQFHQVCFLQKKPTLQMFYIPLNPQNLL